MLFELADDSIAKLEYKDELDTLDGAMLDSFRLELLLELVDDTLEDRDGLDRLDGEVLLDPPPEPPPPHPTIIPPAMAKHKYRPNFDRII